MTFEPTRNEQDQFSTRAQRAEVTLTCEVRQNATRPWARVIGRRLLLLGASPVQRPCSEPP